MENGQIEIIGEHPVVESGSASQEEAVRMAKIVFFVLVSGMVVFLPFGLLISEEKPAPKNQAAVVMPEPAIKPYAPVPKPSQPVTTPPQVRPGQPTQAPQAQMDVVNPSVSGVIQPSAGAGTSGASTGTRMIRDMMTNALISVSDCRLIAKPLVLPAVNRGGSEICRQGSIVSAWPVSDLCGPRAEDTRFIVRDDGSENWDMTIQCAQFSDCNGPMNAICDKDGCKFGGTCK